MTKPILLASLAIGLAAVSAVPAEAGSKQLNGAKPLLAAHRGASGYLPDHTIEGYTRAIELGADLIEPDLVSTKDGVLVARHEPMLGGTTNVADHPEFADRKVTRNIDGIPTTDWFACDFTLAEIKTLRAKQPLAERDQSHNGKYLIPTLDEVIELAKAQSATVGRTIGIYPETKHPTFHAAMGLPLEDRLLARLAKEGWTEKTSPVIIQSFEVGNLQYMRGKTNARLMQLVDADDVDMDGGIVLAAPSAQPYDFVVTGNSKTYKDMVTKAGLAEIARYADGVAPWKPYIWPAKQIDNDKDGKPDDLNGDGKIDERDRVLLAPTTLVADAHAAGLLVHTWTFRAEPRRLASDYKGDAVAEIRSFLELGVDGVFSDFTDVAAKARATME